MTASEPTALLHNAALNAAYLSDTLAVLDRTHRLTDLTRFEWAAALGVALAQVEAERPVHWDSDAYPIRWDDAVERLAERALTRWKQRPEYVRGLADVTVLRTLGTTVLMDLLQEALCSSPT